MSEVPPTQPEPTPEPIAAAEAIPPTEPAPAAQPAPPSAPALGPGPSAEEKSQAMLAWFLAIPTGVIAPLIFFLMATDKPFLKRQAGMVLGLQVCLIIGSIIGGILTMVLIGIFILLAIWIANLVFCIMGGLAAKDGKEYDIPMVGPFIKKTLNL
jgi:uncharacterized Tic20 family protein